MRVRALGLTIATSLTDQIQEAQDNALKPENVVAECLHGMVDLSETKSDGTLYFMNTVWVPVYGDLRELVLSEAHESGYWIHPGTDKMFKDLKEFYWWPNFRRDIAAYVARCLT